MLVGNQYSSVSFSVLHYLKYFPALKDKQLLQYFYPYICGGKKPTKNPTTTSKKRVGQTLRYWASCSPASFLSIMQPPSLSLVLHCSAPSGSSYSAAKAIIFFSNTWWGKLDVWEKKCMSSPRSYWHAGNISFGFFTQVRSLQGIKLSRLLRSCLPILQKCRDLCLKSGDLTLIIEHRKPHHTDFSCGIFHHSHLFFSSTSSVSYYITFSTEKNCSQKYWELFSIEQLYINFIP